MSGKCWRINQHKAVAGGGGGGGGGGETRGDIGGEEGGEGGGGGPESCLHLSPDALLWRILTQTNDQVACALCSR